MLIEKGDIKYFDLGYNKNLSRGAERSKSYIAYGDNAGGDLTGTYPRPHVRLRVYTQTTEPSLSDNDVCIWVSSGDSKVYLVFKPVGLVQVMVELTTGLVASSSLSPSASTSPSASLSPSPSESPSESPSVSPSGA